MSGKIRVCDIEKYYGNKNNLTKAVNRISFQVQNGEFVGIMGASGSGKTTLLNCISTIDRPTSGSIRVDGEELTGLRGRALTRFRRELPDKKLADFRKDHLGFVFQDFNLLDTLTLKENIVLAMALHTNSRKKIEEQVSAVMKRLGIYELRNRFPYEVSGGQKQRCACARALINRPDLILADEPTGALDSRSAQMLLETFTAMNDEMGATILMVTHDAFSASYCSRILFLKDGGIFHELVRGAESRREFLNEILDVLSLTGGEGACE